MWRRSNPFFGSASGFCAAGAPFNPLKNEAQLRQLEQQDDGIEFSHTLEEQIGGQLKAGFRLTHLYGDTNGCGYLQERNIETFLATRAVKP